MPEVYTNVVRLRVSFPKPAYARLEKMAERLVMDVPTLIRVLASIQLVGWELALEKGSELVSDASADSKAYENLAELFSDLKK